MIGNIDFNLKDSMAICIIIVKYKQENQIHYYKVEGHRSTFYIGIDSHKKLIYFFDLNDENFSHPIAIINPYIGPVLATQISDLYGLDSSTAIIQAYKALEKNDFPDYIGKQS